MDTLDKKMQTILDSEDIPTDQRLKLYDQSMYIYLNVFDDYRPKPEVSTPTPESESIDPIESEILDRVPKTTRGKGR
jgi:small-conductance mechanosensitive channel